MTPDRPARRRFITISAVFGGGLFLTGLNAFRRPATASPLVTTHTAYSTHTWTGIALGADASLQISHPDNAAAQTLIERCVAEVRRLEHLFSLYRDDSALVTLNRQGILNDPPSDFLTLLGRSKEFSRLTQGVFDVTVQPLWQAYADYFTANHDHNTTIANDTHTADNGALPPALQRDIQNALKRVNWRKLDIDTQRIQLAQPGMAVTLNGIAQGYITDRITQLLASNGVDHALVNMGEIYGLNPAQSESGIPAAHPDSDQPWQVGLENARNPGNIVRRIPLHNQAVATSGAYGTPFTPDLHHNHLLDPRHGTSSHRYHSISVVAADATTADALSTAFSLMPEAEIRTLSHQLGVKTYLQAVGESSIRQV